MMGITCYIIHVSYIFKLSYVYEKTSRYYLNNFLNVYFFEFEYQVPKLTYLSCSVVHIFTRKCIIVELFVIGLAGLLNLDCKSKSFSRLKMFFRTQFVLTLLVYSQ
jgi:hypothetical protein